MPMNTVAQQFADCVKRHARRFAVITESGESWTYAELDQKRVQAARALIALGIRPGDRVAIWAQNCEEWIVAGLAALTTGAVLVPVNTRMKGEEAGYVLKQSGARLLFCPGKFLNQHYAALLGEYRPPCVETIVILRDALAGDLGWQGFLGKGAMVGAD